MQVNNASLSAQVNPLVQNQTDTQQQSRVAEQLREQQKQQEEQRQQRVERIQVDENAIAVLERENQQRQNVSSNDSQTSYDTPPEQNNTAIATYQSVSSIERRDNVQQLLGVDLFA